MGVVFLEQKRDQREPEWSPDGKSIAFRMSVNGVPQIFTKALDAIDAAQVTHSTETCTSPFWSDDGSRIYYFSKNGLWVILAAGGTPERVLDNVQFATIHPDGKTVVFVRGGKLFLDVLGAERSRDFGAPPLFGGAMAGDP
jgi:TolB protein